MYPFYIMKRVGILTAFYCIPNVFLHCLKFSCTNTHLLLSVPFLFQYILKSILVDASDAKLLEIKRASIATELHFMYTTETIKVEELFSPNSKSQLGLGIKIIYCIVKIDHQLGIIIIMIRIEMGTRARHMCICTVKVRARYTYMYVHLRTSARCVQ